MKYPPSNRLWAFVLAVTFGITSPAAAQVTTGSIAGTITDESGGVLPGATITATHEETGSKSTAVSGTGGSYAILNIRAGGPYSVIVVLPGFKNARKSSVVVPLGASATVGFKLALQAMTETLEVVAERTLISATASGAASNVSQESI